MNRGDKVEVRWVDIMSEPSWIKETQLSEPPIVKTIGYYISHKVFHTKECLVLAGSLGADGDISNIDIIPTGTIISIENCGG